MHFHRGRPPRLARLGNAEIIRKLREEATYRAASQSGHGHTASMGDGTEKTKAALGEKEHH